MSHVYGIKIEFAFFTPNGFYCVSVKAYQLHDPQNINYLQLQAFNSSFLSHLSSIHEIIDRLDHEIQKGYILGVSSPHKKISIGIMN